MNNTAPLLRAVTQQYGAPEGLEDFVRKAHAVDYDGTRAMFEAFRVRMPLSTGIVQWMLNSAWPSLYWQLYDWYGVPTAGYYGVKKACEPEQLIYNYGDRRVYAVSERPEGRTLTATLQVFDAASKLVGSESRTVRTSYRSVTPVFDLGRYAGKPHFVALMLTAEDGSPVAENFYALSAADTRYDFARTSWYDTPILTWRDLRFVFGQGGTDINVTVDKVDGGYAVTLENRSDVVVAQNILKALDGSGNLIVPALWSDNFLPLLPHEKKTVICTTDADQMNVALIN
jgi:exo-1,4-beta-D-glucosaminidase